MNVVIIDGQGGGLGRQLVEAIVRSKLEVELTAIGTNSLATSAMIKAGARKAATGENAVVVACRSADIVAGPLGIAIADSLMGEITPAMARAVGQCAAKKVLIPMNLCDTIVVDAPKQPMAQYIDDTVAYIKRLAGS